MAQFPWDPCPDPPQPIAHPPTVPSNVGKLQPSPSDQANIASQQQGTAQNTQPNDSNVRMKTEAGYEGSSNQLPNIPNGLPGPHIDVARQRALGHINQKFGEQAGSQYSMQP